MSLADRLRALLSGPPMSDEDRRAFEQHVVDINARRLRWLLPFMLAMHAYHVVYFSTSATLLRDPDPVVQTWRAGIVAIHVWTLPAVLALGAILWLLPKSPLQRIVGPTAAFVYLAHAAAIVGADQLTLTNMTVFIGYAFGIALVLVTSPLQSLLIYVAGTACSYAAMFAMQPDAAKRTAMLSSSTTAVMVSLVMTMVLYAARRREFAQRLTIDRQREELRALNESLERRVEERVKDIEVLNAQLQAQVRERSSELSFALARLASQRGSDGALKAGTVLAERFEIQAQLGSGGMGAVYSAIDKTSDARVAVKVIHAASVRQVSVLQRFLDEARVVATLNHPAIVRMIHVDVSADGLLFQAQELVDGETLEKHLSRAQPAPAQAARIASVLAEALAFAHAKNVIHRDVKPSNVMLTATAPGLKLLDFGIAKLTDAAERKGSATAVGVVVGTPAYMAPEQLEGYAVESSADAYALGVVLHRMLTGQLPSRDPPTKPPPSADTREIVVDPHPPPRALTELVERCMHVDPARRPTLAECAKQLRAFADDNGAPALEVIASGPAAGGAAVDTVSMTKKRPGSSEGGPAVAAPAPAATTPATSRASSESG